MAVSVVFEVTEALATEADISRLLQKHFNSLTSLTRLGAVSVLSKKKGDERTQTWAAPCCCIILFPVGQKAPKQRLKSVRQSKIARTGQLQLTKSWGNWENIIGCSGFGPSRCFTDAEVKELPKDSKLLRLAAHYSRGLWSWGHRRHSVPRLKLFRSLNVLQLHFAKTQRDTASWRSNSALVWTPKESPLTSIVTVTTASFIFFLFFFCHRASKWNELLS